MNTDADMNPPPFDLMESPIGGTSLIEAGAGTGKTYTITGIVLRLIVARGISISRILVVTFTEAATEELKSRIRDRLKEALAVFRGEASEDAFLNRLADECRRRSETAAAAAAQALTEAIRDFDEAAIFTIHGFCNRILRENAFESGALFDTELTADQDRILRVAVEDYWRIHLYTADPVFVRYALVRTSPDQLFSLLKRHLSQPDITVIPAGEAPDVRNAEADFKKAYEALRNGRPSWKNEIAAILLNNTGLNQRTYGRASVPVWLDRLDLYLRTETPHPVLPEKFEKFTPAMVAAGTKKACSPPDHPFFHLCGELQRRNALLIDLYEQKLIHFKRALFSYAKEHIRQRKIAGNIQSFDDLLARLSDALAAPGGSLLAESVRGRYQAALIDEFQDTDPVQYHIFQTLFDAAGHLLFLIGDPKQAIYSFRGADIFAYMSAAQKAAARYTLGTNWRSNPRLVTAVNAVFGGRPRAFVYDEIPFGPACAPEGKPEDAALLRIDGECPPPFTIWRLAPATVGDARKAVTRAVAAEISRLVDRGRKGTATIGESPLVPGDIAVLVRANHEAAAMQTALTAWGVPSVLFNTGDIFDTREAAETATILAAMTDPGNERRIRAALVTDMLGVSGEALAETALNEAGWEAWLIRFAGYHHLWMARGFIRMFREFLVREAVLPRLMSLPDGERRCTNTLHVSELLHQAGLAGNVTPARLTAWLVAQRLHAEDRREEHPLRLESDENAVKLVTIHKSKGLEYPVVFCPFAWGSSRLQKNRNDGEGILFHDEANGRCLTCDLGSEHAARHQAWAEKEALAENLRLLYVALTRAKSRCYVAWGPVSQAGTSAPAYLFHGREEDTGGDADLLGALDGRFKAMEDADWEADLAAVERRSGGTVEVLPLPENGGIRYFPYEGKIGPLSARRFRGRIVADVGISSFSSIVSATSAVSPVTRQSDAAGTSGVLRPAGGIHDPAELADHDDLPVMAGALASGESPDDPSSDILAGLPADHATDRVPPSPDGMTIFDFPRGAQAGTCLHEIFEHVDFRRTRPRDVTGLIEDTLRKYRFGGQWAPAVAEMVQRVVRLDLDPEDDAPVSISGPAPQEDASCSLSTVSMARRINEMAFYFPLLSVTSRQLETVFAAHGITGPAGDFPERVGRLAFSRTRGMMKGFIDLVFAHKGKFYIVDWKSNHLGSRPEDYRPEVLDQVMADAFYILQYHLYAVALHRYLKHRLPGYDYDTHFGGVRYLFVRGIDPDASRSFGMFKDRPQAAAVSALEAILVDGSHIDAT